MLILQSHLYRYIALFVVSLVCYLTTFVFSGFLFHWFTPSGQDCGLNTFFIVMTLIFVFVFAIVALHPAVSLYFRIPVHLIIMIVDHFVYLLCFWMNEETIVGCSSCYHGIASIHIVICFDSLGLRTKVSELDTSQLCWWRIGKFSEKMQVLSAFMEIFTGIQLVIPQHFQWLPHYLWFFLCSERLIGWEGLTKTRIEMSVFWSMIVWLGSVKISGSANFLSRLSIRLLK